LEWWEKGEGKTEGKKKTTEEEEILYIFIYLLRFREKRKRKIGKKGVSSGPPDSNQERARKRKKEREGRWPLRFESWLLINTQGRKKKYNIGEEEGGTRLINAAANAFLWEDRKKLGGGAG